MAVSLSLPQQLSWSHHVASWAAPQPRSSAPCLGGDPIPLWIEDGAGKKRVPRSNSPKVLNLRSIKQLTGTTQRPRLLVFFSDRHLYAQILDDSKKEMLISASTAQLNSLVEKGSVCPILDAAKKLGEEVALQCFKMGVSSVIYYRRGSLHWKRVRTFRLAAEEFGLMFEYPN